MGKETKLLLQKLFANIYIYIYIFIFYVIYKKKQLSIVLILFFSLPGHFRIIILIKNYQIFVRDGFFLWIWSLD